MRDTFFIAEGGAREDGMALPNGPSETRVRRGSIVVFMLRVWSCSAD